MKKRHNCGAFLLLKIKEANMSEIRFSSKAHEQFYYQMLERCGKSDSYYRSFFTVWEFPKIPEIMLNKSLISKNV